MLVQESRRLIPILGQFWSLGVWYCRPDLSSWCREGLVTAVELTHCNNMCFDANDQPAPGNPYSICIANLDAVIPTKARLLLAPASDVSILTFVKYSQERTENSWNISKINDPAGTHTTYATFSCRSALFQKHELRSSSGPLKAASTSASATAQ